MTLQKQLLLISLSIFALPWAGCEFVKEMDTTLKDGQVRSLKAQARAIAITLQNSEFFSSVLAKTENKKEPLNNHIYFDHINSTPIIDGYNSEWKSVFIKPRRFYTENNASYFDLNTGIFDNIAYLAFYISDKSQIFHNPQKSGIANGDHIILHSKDKFFRNIDYILQNSGSGNFIGYYRDANGTIKPQSAIKGFWRETGEGYIVEANIPFGLLNNYLGISYIDQTTTIKKSIYSSMPERIIQYSIDLEKTISPYTDPGMSMFITNTDQWILAKSQNNLPTISPNDDTFWLIKWMYKYILDKKHLPMLTNEKNDGKFIFRNPESLLTHEQTATWFQLESEPIARVTAPIFKNNIQKTNNNILGFVILEQSASSVAAATNVAFNRLFLITLSAVIFVTVILLAYASLLSFRIRRLRNATDTAISSDGKINRQFMSTTARDEVGDLTRSYKQLLERLDDYTEYLRTLASKLSHELRTPLAVIKSSLDNLNQNSSDQNHKTSTKDQNQHAQYIKRASEGAERLSNILNAMSAANRIEESIHDTEIITFTLAPLLEELIAAYQATYPQKNISLTIDGYQNKSPSFFSINGSPDLIVQMLDKLIDNALDFCPDGGAISFELNHSSSASLILSVANTGPLLPLHMQGQLFDSLVSLRDENTDIHSSPKTHLGLGLHIVRLIAHFHRGNVTAQNLDDKTGVVFLVELPTCDP
ncbi:MAG: ATP-binding protein [Cellvibrionaceae bacterium]